MEPFSRNSHVFLHWHPWRVRVGHRGMGQPPRALPTSLPHWSMAVAKRSSSHSTALTAALQVLEHVVAPSERALEHDGLRAATAALTFAARVSQMFSPSSLAPSASPKATLPDGIE